MKKETFRGILDVAFYAVAFLALQYVSFMAVFVCNVFLYDGDVAETSVFSPELLATTFILSSALTIAVFLQAGGARLGLDAFRRYSWQLFASVGLLGASLMLPSEWIMELAGLNLAKENAELQLVFEAMASQPVIGFLALAVLGPIAEELVMRGAVLRRLLAIMPTGKHWWAIAISAVLFGLIHGNFSQGLHATLIGMLMGWLYYKTRSIMPGVVFHCTNNALAFVSCIFLQDKADDSLLNLFQSNQTALALALIASLTVGAMAFAVIMKTLPKS